MKIKEIKNYLDELYPFENKCEWDNCGLLTGNEENEVKKIGFALDLTPEVLKDAENNGVNLIVTHHPVIFTAQKSFLSGNIAYEAAVKGMSVICCHTCYDSANGGVSDILAEKIGLSSVKILETEEKPFCVRIGETVKTTPELFAKNVAKSLGTTVRFSCGSRDIERVAVCSGSGGDFVEESVLYGADAFVTGDMSHHQFLLAEEKGITLIAAGHFETENIAIKPLMDKVKTKFSDIECILLCQHNPVKFISPEE